jgi:phosphomannomutase/phosphoglucomutase
VVEEVKEELRTEYPIIDVDGVRVKFDDGWGLVRASNTQPILVLRFEALTEKRLAEIKKLIEDKVRSAIFSLQTP